jgi:hypothetical protein
MTDGVNAVESVVNQQESQPSTVENVSVDNNVAPVSSVEKPIEHKPEKLFTRDEVAKIANAEKQKAIEKARREFEASKNLEALKPQQQPNIAEQSQPSHDSNPEQLRSFVQQEIASQAQAQAQEMFFQRNINDFQGKIAKAQEKYPDYLETVNKLSLDKMPEPALKSLISLMNVAENGGEVLYDVAKYPSKYASILNLIAIPGNGPQLAIAEIQRLSRSLTENDQAVKAKAANPPLSQVNPSTTGTDNGSMTLRDMKRQPWARG